MDVSLKFYPTGVIEDTRYSIHISNDSLAARNYRPMNSEDIVEFHGKLTKIQYDNLCDLKTNIKSTVKNENPTISDTWGVTLVINGEVIYKDDDFSFDKPPKGIENLIKYLVEISRIKIDLYGFS